jgi:hypothetical protein
MGKVNDQFANIANNLGRNLNKQGLERVKPAEIQHQSLQMGNFDGLPIHFPEKMNDQAALEAELQRMRNQFKPFLVHQAPEVKNYRTRQELTEFKWRVETDTDQTDFTTVLSGDGEWETVSVPHFGRPLGNKTTYYRQTFDIDSVTDEQSLFVHFNGVDYIANVFVNGYFVGTHEGLFAPFEFEIENYIHSGTNTLVVQVKNDFIHKRNELEAGGTMYGGDKIYAATGPGFDDPALGWHHCPPGMGIYQDVYLEKRARDFISEVYVRPLFDEHKAEVNIDLYHCDLGERSAKFNISIYGENFVGTVVKDQIVEQSTGTAIGLGDTFTEAMLSATGQKDKENTLNAEKGHNYFKFIFDIPDMKVWSSETPYLYEVQVGFIDDDDTILDANTRTFGMRKFHMDEASQPKGKLYLNNQEIHLRGANTMGFEQHDVMRGELDQLVDDILLAKIAHMNFWRITQRPVQETVYDYCDHLGLMTQTDLPLFGVLRRNKFSEAVKQAGEMEQIVRKHPCNIVDTFINEPFPNANNLPQRHLIRPELERFFTAAKETILCLNPDRVIKPVDGDYDPPAFGLPDNHCYTSWYNSSGETMGELAAGYWLPVKKGWNYACGEYGCEGLDNLETMYNHYPANWLPASPDDDWSPTAIAMEQSSNFHYQYFETPKTLRNWVMESQRYQAFATQWMTESFRRQTAMISTVLHIFIDHFPAGWMKAVIDNDRIAKPAYFAYRDALTPTMVSFKPRRFRYFEGETAAIETWICNDLPEVFDSYSLYYEVVRNHEVLRKGVQTVGIQPSCSAYAGDIQFDTTGIAGEIEVRAALIDQNNQVVHYNTLNLKIASQNTDLKGTTIQAGETVGSLLNTYTNYQKIGDSTVTPDTIIIDDMAVFKGQENKLRQKVEAGTKLVLYRPAPGTYRIFDEDVKIKPCGMLPVNFVSRNTGHLMVDGFEPDDFRFWFDEKQQMITPILENTFTSHNKNYDAILTSANMNIKGEWRPELACGERKIGKGSVIICELILDDRLKANPVAQQFAKKMLIKQP